MQPFSDAATEVSRNLDPKYLKEGEQILIGFEGPFVSRRVTPRDLLSSFIGSMVCVEGIVTKCTFSLPFLFSLGYSDTYLKIIYCFIFLDHDKTTAPNSRKSYVIKKFLISKLKLHRTKTLKIYFCPLVHPVNKQAEVICTSILETGFALGRWQRLNIG